MWIYFVHNYSSLISNVKLEHNRIYKSKIFSELHDGKGTVLNLTVTTCYLQMIKRKNQNIYDNIFINKYKIETYHMFFMFLNLYYHILGKRKT